MKTKIKIQKMLSGELDMALKRRAEIILEELNPKAGDRLLDAGCGAGYYLDLILRLRIKNIELIGIDIEKESVKKLQQKYEGKNVKIILSDVSNTPFKANSFDKIILSEVLEHVTDDIKTLKELKRILKPGGIILITVPNHYYPFFWDPVNWILEKVFSRHVEEGRWKGIWTNHLRLYSRSDLVTLVERAGFKIEESRALTNRCLPFNGYLLYGGKFSPSFSSEVLKKVRSTEKPLWARFVLFLLNTFDKLNDLFPSSEKGVCVFIKAVK